MVYTVPNVELDLFRMICSRKKIHKLSP
jgi:hypothetical protein